MTATSHRNHDGSGRSPQNGPAGDGGVGARLTNNRNFNRRNNRLNNANDSKSRNGSDHVVISCIRIEEETTMIEKGKNESRKT